jgi:hypothetical protein
MDRLLRLAAVNLSFSFRTPSISWLDRGTTINRGTQESVQRIDGEDAVMFLDSRLTSENDRWYTVNIHRESSTSRYLTVTSVSLGSVDFFEL